MRETQHTSNEDENRFAAGNGAPSSPVDDIGRQAQETVDQVRSNLADGADRSKSAVASIINDVAEVIEGAAEQFSQRGQISASHYTRAMGSGLSSLSHSMESKSFGEIVGDVTELARRHPAAFVGGAMLLGMALSRVAKASGTSITSKLSETVSNAMPVSGTSHRFDEGHHE